VNPTHVLHAMGQRLWVDNITRTMLDSGTLQRYIDTLQVTGLTSNPTIFDMAIGSDTQYDAAIAQKARQGLSGEALFVELALEDLCRAADIFLPMHRASGGHDGWVSMEISPLLAQDTAGSLQAARQIFALAGRPNLFVKIPGTPESLPAIEAAIFAGIPVNVTLLFSCAQYLAAAEAYIRGVERLLTAGLPPAVMSVASVFVSRWDVAIKDKVPGELHNRLGIAVCEKTLQASRELLASERWQRLARAGALPQRVLWASTGSKDPQASDTLYVEALAAPDTINTLPEKTLLAFADHGRPGHVMPLHGAQTQALLDRFTGAGIDIDALAGQLQREGAEAFVKSWRALLLRIAGKCQALVP